MPSKVYEALMDWDAMSQGSSYPDTIQVPARLMADFFLAYETGTLSQTVEAITTLHEWLAYYLNVNPQEPSSLNHTLQEPPGERPPRLSSYRDQWDRMGADMKALITAQVFQRDGFHCRHCGTQDKLTVDHIIPLIKGGTNDLDNLQTLCKSCNSRKGNR